MSAHDESRRLVGSASSPDAAAQPEAEPEPPESEREPDPDPEPGPGSPSDPAGRSDHDTGADPPPDDLVQAVAEFVDDLVEGTAAAHPDGNTDGAGTRAAGDPAGAAPADTDPRRPRA